MDFSRPGKPTDNAKVAAFNGRLRQECLNAQWFLSLAYNEIRPLSSLWWSTPLNSPAMQALAGNDDTRRAGKFYF